MLKVLIASHAGVLEVNRSVFLELRSYGIEVSFLVPNFWRGDLIQNLQFQKGESEREIQFFPLDTILSGNGSLFLYRGLFSVPKDFDILLIDEEPWSLAALQLSLWAGKRKKIFYTKQNLKKTIPWIFRQIQKLVFASSTAALSVEQEVAEVLRWKGYQKEIFDFPHSYDAQLFRPLDSRAIADSRTTLGLDPKLVTVIYCGRLTEEKGIADLLEVMEKMPETSVQFLIVGNGPWKEQVAQVADKKKNVKLIAAIPHLLIGKTMACGDIFILPSRTRKNWKEQFGRVIIEAMACGAMVIGSDSGAIARVIQRCGGGVCYPEGDRQELFRLVTKFAEEPESRRLLQEKGRDYVSSEFTHQALAKSLAGFLRRL
jgi:glycosyltransferase involved in cell wall biosynthesis